MKLLKVKPYEQKLSDMCGPAALKMVLDFFGLEKTERELIKACRASHKDGTEAENIVKAVEKYGMRGVIKNFADFDDIKKHLSQSRPIIVNWFSKDDGHYSVVVGLDRQNIFLQDPEIGGIRKMKRQDFFRIWFDFPGLYLKDKDDLIVRRLIVIYP
jgi:predicted double-glycine peptidase